MGLGFRDRTFADVDDDNGGEGAAVAGVGVLRSGRKIAGQ